jgi:hypothetical protein
MSTAGDLKRYEDTYFDNYQHSVRADVRRLNRHDVADAAHKNFGASIQRLESLEQQLAREFSLLEERQKQLLETGTRAEADLDSKPLVAAAHLAWLTERVGKPPLPPPVVG